MYRICVFLLLLSCSLLIFSQEIYLKAEVMIDSESNQIYLYDFAENPELLKELGKDEIIFGYSPMPGRSMKVSLDYVIGKFNRYLDGFTFVRPEGDIVVVYRKALSTVSEATSEASILNDLEINSGKYDSQILDEKTLKALILSSFEKKLEIRFDEKIDVEYEQFPLTPLKGRLESINIYSRGSKKYMVRIETLTGDGSREYETAIFSVKWPVTGIKTLKLIRKDVLLSEEYLFFEEIDYFDFKDPVLKSSLPDDYVAKYTISEGKILEWSMLKKRSYVLKGQVISAMARLSGVTVTSKVEMLENAEIGQLVSAKNLDSGIVITGIVEEGPVLRVTY